MPNKNKMHKIQPRQSLREVFSDPVMRIGAVITISFFLLLYGYVLYIVLLPPATYETWVINRIESKDYENGSILLCYDYGRNTVLLPDDGYEYELGETYWISVKYQNNKVREILNRERR